MTAEMAALRRDFFLPPDLKPLLDAQGFDGCVAVQARQSLEETRWLLELAERHDFIQGVVGWVDLCSPELPDQLEKFAQHPKLVGVRHLLQDEPDDGFMLRPEFRRGLALLRAFDLTYDLLVYPRQLPAAVKLWRRFQSSRSCWTTSANRQLPRVSCRPGTATCGSWRRGRMSVASFRDGDRGALESVAAGRFRRYLDLVFDAFGARRLMIGSDWPVCTLSAEYAATLRIVTEAIQQFSLAEQAGILGKIAPGSMASEPADDDAGADSANDSEYDNAGLGLYRPGRMELREIPQPRAADGECVIAVSVAAVCGSDLAAFLGRSRSRTPPMVLGHELVGRRRDGQRVVVNPFICCGRCAACRSGAQNLCPNWRLLGMNDTAGCYAQFVGLSERQVYAIPEELAEERAILAEPLANIVHLFRIAAVLPAWRMGIVGGGLMGSLALQMALHTGLRAVLVEDLCAARLDRCAPWARRWRSMPAANRAAARHGSLPETASMSCSMQAGPRLRGKKLSSFAVPVAWWYCWAWPRRAARSISEPASARNSV